MNHERNKFMKRSLENEGAHPLFKGARAPILFEGSSTHYLRGLEHSLFRRARALIIRRQLNREQVNKCKMDMKEIKFVKCSLEKMRARTHFSRGREHPSF